MSDKKEAVNHPSHYNTGKYEVIDVIDDWKLDFELGNAVKYIARAGHKDVSKYKEDLNKAIWYIQREIDKLCDKEFVCNLDKNIGAVKNTNYTVATDGSSVDYDNRWYLNTCYSLDK